MFVNDRTVHPVRERRGLGSLKKNGPVEEIQAPPTLFFSIHSRHQQARDCSFVRRVWVDGIPVCEFSFCVINFIIPSRASTSNIDPADLFRYV
jgi:hypothetical protein